jgi:hypothetical protein
LIGIGETSSEPSRRTVWPAANILVRLEPMAAMGR